MKKVIATIEETVVDTFEFKIEDDEDELEIAVEKYKNGELVLTPGEVMRRQIMTEIIGKPHSSTEWIEF